MRDKRVNDIKGRESTKIFGLVKAREDDGKIRPRNGINISNNPKPVKAGANPAIFRAFLPCEGSRKISI